MTSQLEGSGILARLSPELFEAVLQNLDLASLQQLRLVSHQISKRCLGPHFKALIEAIPVTTDLSAESLRHLNERASHPWLGCTVKNITVTDRHGDAGGHQGRGVSRSLHLDGRSRSRRHHLPRLLRAGASLGVRPHHRGES